MASKFQDISDLYKIQLSQISASEKNWIDFLDVACRFYKYSFPDQVLIYSQKPEATACASYDIWNKKFHRYINKKVSGLALIDDSGMWPRLKYVFDISDTNAPKGIPEPYLWAMKPEFEENIRETLEAYFGDLDVDDIIRKRPKRINDAILGKTGNYTLTQEDIEKLKNSINFHEFIENIVNEAVEDNLLDYTEQFIKTKNWGNLKIFENEDKKALFEALIRESITYMVMRRLEPDAELSIQNLDLSTLFDTRETIIQVGTAVSDISEIVLRPIERTIKAIENPYIFDYRKYFAKSDEITHNENKEQNNRTQLERSSEYETDVQPEQRLSNTKHKNEPASTTIRQVWTNEKIIPEGTPQGRIQYNDDVGNFSGAPSGYRPDSEATSRNDDREAKRTGKRAGQRQRPVSVDTVPEQLKINSRANSDVNNIRIERQEQKAEELISSAFSISENPLYIGKELEIENHVYSIERIYTSMVDLRDKTFEANTGFPIFRNESIEFIEQILQNSKQKITKDKEISLEKTELKEKIAVEPINFFITDDQLGIGGTKTKAQNNISAITLLKQLEADDRHATPEEQEILSKYVGWGGIPQVFDKANVNWTNEYTQIKELLTEEEYEKARESTLTAFYTSPLVCRGIYKAIENMGFRKGNVLEPSMGTGNFFGLLPDEMRESKLYGVELDSISGRIAQKLYPNTKITIGGFETADLPDSFFDVAIGNIPFGNFRVQDERYNKYKFNIHDYFIAKALDKVRTGGVIAFITSKGTLDKKDNTVRKYIAERAELIGAIRLPNTAFYANANTQVTSDILFFQKRERLIANAEPEWLNLGSTSEGIPVNKYFELNPEMILGNMVYDKSMYGNVAETACEPFSDKSLEELLNGAINNIKGHIPEPELDLDIDEMDEIETIPADPNVRNFSFTEIDKKIYFRENSVMHNIITSNTAEKRIHGMIKIRDCIRELIELQLHNCTDDELKSIQGKLNTLYNRYTAKYGLMNSRGNSMAFSDDSGYPLLCSLEILNDDNTLKKKADIFSKRTIKPYINIEKAETAQEALAASISELAHVDLKYMSSLLGGLSQERIIQDLKGQIFENPTTEKWEPADEYLSGNVKHKLNVALQHAKNEPERYIDNVEALKNVQPKDLTAAEISVSLGATWIPVGDINQFMYETFRTPDDLKPKIKVSYSPIGGMWNISNKRMDYSSNVLANTTFGTKRINGYEILQSSLNLKEVKIFDIKKDTEGNEKRVLNSNDTTLAQQKQEELKETFRNWIFKEPERRERLTKLYNDTFNNIVPRNFNGEYVKFHGINPEIKLRPYQKNAVARIIYGGNTLLAHCVGAGKTIEMSAAAMELKNLGLCSKSMIVVPNHLIEQWAGEFLQLYPSANILVTTKKDFETTRRKKFCSRIATGEYDVVVIGHSQFERIPVSKERQEQFIENQINEIIESLDKLKREKGENFAIKQMELTKKKLKEKLEKVKDERRKDNVIDFEELGVDRLFVDEAHLYKNLFLYTKMRNVAGIGQTDAKKSNDLYMKCRYIDEITNYRGIIFATGTPISNSMCELYTMMRYLQNNILEQQGLLHFDSWASIFGETVTALELAVEGNGYRIKTRFAKYNNTPELLLAFKLCADIQTADMLKLPVPKVEYKTEVTKPSTFQLAMVKEFGERAEKIQNGRVDPRIDNKLKITTDGRKLALDQRLINPLLPDEQDSKVNRCVNNVLQIWKDTKDNKSAQLIFSDLSTPSNDNIIDMQETSKGHFEMKPPDQFRDVYNDMRNKLIQHGIPSEQICFIHEAKTDAQKKELFSKVRNGEVRVLLGSTLKMGAGTNVQNNLIALHHLDVPWRPSDIEQREGRIVRYGNTNDTVYIYRYVTENTFDAYSWQVLEKKQRFINQLMNGTLVSRSCEDIDATALSFAELKALSAGDPRIKERMELELDVQKLQLLKRNYNNERYMLEDNVLKYYPRQIKRLNENISNYKADIITANNNAFNNDNFSITIDNTNYIDKKQGAEMLLTKVYSIDAMGLTQIGKYRGFSIKISFDRHTQFYKIHLCGKGEYITDVGFDTLGNIARLNNLLDKIPEMLEEDKAVIKNLMTQIENGKEELKKPFDKENELLEKSSKLNELNSILNLDKKTIEVIAEPEEETVTNPSEKEQCVER